MKETPELSEVKRALLEKYLRGEALSTVKTVAAEPPAQEAPAPLLSVDSRSPLVPVQTGGSRRPLFYIHVHWVGGAFYSFPLARDLGADQPFYVLDPYKFDGLRHPPTLEEMAADYVKVIRAVQPQGPYSLGGFCGGCVIAFEIAQQLQAAGQEVELLVLIEPGVTGRMIPVLEQYGPFYMKFMGKTVRSLGRLLRLGPVKSLDAFLYLRHLYRLLRYMGRKQGRDLALFPTSEMLRQDWMGIFVWIVSAYVPRLYQGKVTYFWAREEPPSRRAAWDRMGTRATITEYKSIAGTHDSCRNEDLHDMAEQLKKCLDQLQEATMNKAT